MDAKEWNRIVREWNAEFPFLKRFGNSKLFFKTDIMLIGIWFDRILGEWYRPMIECQPLWRNNVNMKKMNPFFIEIHDSRNLTIECKYIYHDRYFKKNVGLISQQYGNLLSGNVTYNDLYDIEEKRFELYQGLNCMYQMLHIEYLLVLATYFNNEINMEEIFTKIEKCCKKWPKQPKEMEILQSNNITLDDWKRQMYNYYGNKEAFLEVCRKHSEDKDIKKLNMGVLINDQPFIKKSIWDKLSDLFKRHR